MVASRFRARKLGLKQNLQILRESEIDQEELLAADSQHDLLERLPKVESGVDQKEEKEHHLQAVISAAHASSVGGKVAQIFIPTPDAVPSDIPYDRLYPANFSQPATYIRFSSTVEDSIGCPYCMSAQDVVALANINSKVSKGGQTCSEDQFEIVMNFFEEMSQTRQPFAAVDNTPVLSFEEMQEGFEESLDELSQHFASDIYEYWKEQRLEHGNRSLMPKLKTLKMDTTQDNDDADPYVCFRRREVRQVRKTRGRDAQVTEKLKKLRMELETARQLVSLVKEREDNRKTDLADSKSIFDMRAQMRGMKRSLNIHDEQDDELLITQKKKRVVEPPNAARPPQSLKLTSSRLEGVQGAELDVTSLRQKLDEREKAVETQVLQEIANHERRGHAFIDRTEEAIWGLIPKYEDLEIYDNFVTAKIQFTQQPTPPESLASESSGGEEENQDFAKASELQARWAYPSEQKTVDQGIRYRRRIGRGGRQMLDRHNFRNTSRSVSNARIHDRFKHDRDDGDEDENPELPDPNGTPGFRYREQLRWKDNLRHSRNFSGSGQSLATNAPGQPQR